MEKQISSGNFDSPEGTLDALMQVAACETVCNSLPYNKYLQDLATTTACFLVRNSIERS